MVDQKKLGVWKDTGGRALKARGKIKNLRKGIAEVSLSKAATVPFQTLIILVSREHPEDSLGIIEGDSLDPIC